MKKFVFNFVVSFAGYAVITSLGHVVLNYTAQMNALWFFGLPVILYFVVGLKLQPLHNGLNYLSVSGSFILAASVTTYEMMKKQASINPWLNKSIWRVYLNSSFGLWVYMA